MSLLDSDAISPWIQHICKGAFSNKGVIAGVDDDDCAVIELEDSCLVLTTDFINANPIGIQLNIANLYDLGRLSVIANLSDLLGTGAMPIGYLAGITMEKGSKESDFKLLMHGVIDELKEYDVPLLGGDTKLGKTRAISGVGIGSVKDKEHLLLQTNAKSGHKVWLSGAIGSVNAAVVGYKDSNMSHEWREWAKQRIIKPNLPYNQATELQNINIHGAGTDISDGLSVDLGNMCKKSNVGCILNVESIPFEPEVKELGDALNLEAWSFAFGGGGDYQFLFSADNEFSTKLNSLGFICIGTVVEEMGIFANYQGKKVSLDEAGHRDITTLSFCDENKLLIRNVIERVCS